MTSEENEKRQIVAEHVKELWRFVNHYFGYCYPEDFIPKICKTTDKELKELKFSDYDRTDEGRKLYPEDMNKKLPTDSVHVVCKNNKQYILVNIDRMNKKNPLFRTMLDSGFSKLDYLDQLLIHEFIHVLGTLTKRELMTTHDIDIKIFLKYKNGA